MGPIEALIKEYDSSLAKTRALPHLGRKGSTPLSLRYKDLAEIAKPNVKEPGTQTKFPHLLFIEFIDDKGLVKPHPLLCPMTQRGGRSLTHALVDKGVHPNDIKVITWDWRTGKTKIKSSLEWMLWSWRDQEALEAREEAGK